MTRAQVSLDFLLVAAAFLGILGLMVPLFQEIYIQSLFALDLQQAVAFSDLVSQKSFGLLVFDTESFFWVRANPIGEWKIKFFKNQLQVTVFSSNGSSKFLVRELGLPAFSFEDRIVGSVDLQIQNQSGVLVVHR